MPRKRSPQLRIAPPQYVIAEEITDPAEQAALDPMRKRLKRKKPKTPLHIAPMQIVVGEVVTDPAEIAAMERMRKRLKQKRNRAKTKSKRSGAGPTAKKKQ